MYLLVLLFVFHGLKNSLLESACIIFLKEFSTLSRLPHIFKKNCQIIGKDQGIQKGKSIVAQMKNEKTT